MPISFLSLSNELKFKIFDELYDPNVNLARAQCFGDSPYDYYTFLEIAQAVPALYPICLQYMHRWPLDIDPIFDTLRRVVLDKPELQKVVQGLDLTSAANQQDQRVARWPSRREAETLLQYAARSGYPTADFELQGLYDWVGLAFHLLPNLRAVRLNDGPFGKTPYGTEGPGNSLITRILIGHAHYLHNLQHISLGVTGYRRFPDADDNNEMYDFDLEGTISNILDLPSLRSLQLIDIPFTLDRKTREETAGNPAIPNPSTCTHFRFQNCYITPNELLSIASRCNPEVFIFSPPDQPDPDVDEMETFESFFRELSTSSNFIQHLVELDIHDSTPPRIRPEAPVDLSSLKQLAQVHVPVHIIVGSDPRRKWTRESLPRFIEDLSLESSTNIDEWLNWEEGDYLRHIHDIMVHVPVYFKKLKRLAVDAPTLISDDRYFGTIGSTRNRNHQGDKGLRLEDLFTLASLHGVALSDLHSHIDLKETARVSL